MCGSIERIPLVVPDPGAPLGAADATRRHALELPDVGRRFPGVTATEAEAAIPGLDELSRSAIDDALIEIALPVVLTDGAGPYLVASDGTLVLVVAEHPRVAGVHVAMSGSGDDGTVGAVERGRRPIWVWRARCPVAGERRVEALDALASVAGTPGLQRWAEEWDQAV